MNKPFQQVPRRKALPFTRKLIQEWAGPRVFRDGMTLFREGRVLRAEYAHPTVDGALQYGHKQIRCQFDLLADGSVASHCPCRDNRERGIICPHVVAVALTLVQRHTDPDRARKAEEERRRAARLAEADASCYIKRAAPSAPGHPRATLDIVLGAAWRERVLQGAVPIKLYLKEEDRTRLSVEQAASSGQAFAMSRQDDNLLFVLEDIAEGSVPNHLDVSIPDFINLLNLHGGKPLYCEEQADPLLVNQVPMASIVRMELDRENGQLVLMLHTELPFMEPEIWPTYLLGGKTGWVFDAGQFWPLEQLLPRPLQGIYQRPVYVARPSVPHFLESELPLIEKFIRVETDITPDLFSMEPAMPRFRIAVRGSPASLAATLYAEYDGICLAAGRAAPEGRFALPDPDDLMRYLVRNLEAEQAALDTLARSGFEGAYGDALESIVGSRQVMNFLGRELPRLRRLGWKVDLEGRVAPFLEAADFVTPVVHIEEGASCGLFEVGFDFEDARGESLSAADIQRALRKDEAYIEKNGRTWLLDADAIQTAQRVFADCAFDAGHRAGTFRVDGIHAAYVKASLDALDGVDVEAAPRWRQQADVQNRRRKIEPIELDEALEKILRPYQKEGVYWLHFLASNRLRGILADEMGLGKTLQALAWLSFERRHAAEPSRPDLVVCPTSLIENWAEEAQRFVPDRHVLIISGPDRHACWERLDRADLVITSYALLRRDIDRHLACEYGAVVLDEAQHIKNRATQNAQAAKRLRSNHRLVLTGTPIENSVSDLWSIMDFLMPGYLGAHDAFRLNYELPIDRQGPEGQEAQARLRRKLHPFLLRRLKKDVAKELPPKIQRVAWCTLTRDQQLVYRELLEASRRRIFDLVEAQGFNRSRMEILKTLLRLRQTCCHLELLKRPELKSRFPSGKMDLFFELMDEALDAGHRVLIFSQFTSMLAILRRECEARDLRYCYLDGSTRERGRVVREFNTQREIPLFLISLKAGGVGLNLTGADMVIHFDPWWNPAVEDQATDRAYRIGQKRTVYSVKLITRGTVEEKVLAMQRKKQAVIDAALTRDEQALGKLNWEDVRELLDT